MTLEFLGSFLSLIRLTGNPRDESIPLSQPSQGLQCVAITQSSIVYMFVIMSVITCNLFAILMILCFRSSSY